MPLTQKEIRERYRSKAWVKEKEADYAARRYAEMKVNPKRYALRLKQARESALLRSREKRIANAGLILYGKSKHELAIVFIIALIQLDRERVERRAAWCRQWQKARPKSTESRYIAIRRDPEKLAAFREKNRIYAKAWRARSQPVSQEKREARNRKQMEKYRERISDPVFREKRRMQAKVWRDTESGRKKSACYAAKSRTKNPSHRIGENLRRRISGAIRGEGYHRGRLVALLGIPVADLVKHLETQWLPGMSWENYGLGKGKWSVDHKTPCAAFNLTDPEQQKQCFHFSNLQPMWFTENCSKGNKLPDGSRAIRITT